MPKTATIPPVPLGTAVCIALPLSFKSFIAFLKSNEPLVAKAEYSPSEWPAKYFASPKLILLSFLIISNIE